jgi:hypothetical protein
MTTPVWDDEKRNEAKEMYLERIAEYPAEEQPKMSMEVVASISDELGFTKNSVRAILQRMTNDEGESVYVKAVKAPAARAASTGKKMSKADSLEELRNSLRDNGVELSEEFEESIKSMTGKAALAIAGAIRSIGSIGSED